MRLRARVPGRVPPVCEVPAGSRVRMRVSHHLLAAYFQQDSLPLLAIPLCRLPGGSTSPAVALVQALAGTGGACFWGQVWGLLESLVRGGSPGGWLIGEACGAWVDAWGGCSTHSHQKHQIPRSTEGATDRLQIGPGVRSVREKFVVSPAAATSAIQPTARQNGMGRTRRRSSARGADSAA